MRSLIIIFNLFFLIAASGQNALDIFKTKAKPLHNFIDDIKYGSQIDSLLAKIDKDYSEYNTVYSLDFLLEHKRFADTAKFLTDPLVFKPFEKVDFDNNGLTDLLVFCKWKWNNHLVAFAILNLGNSKFKIRSIYSDDFRYSPVPQLIFKDEIPLIISYNFSQLSVRDNYVRTRLIKDTLVYAFGDFVEYKKQSENRKIKKIELETSMCYGVCPVFKMSIDSLGNTLFNAIKFNMKNKNEYITSWKVTAKDQILGDYRTKLDTASFIQLKELLNYMNFTKLNDKYMYSATDMASANLKITYDDYKVKYIEDYGQQGTPSLNRLYEILFDFRYNQKWISIDK